MCVLCVDVFMYSCTVLAVVVGLACAQLEIWHSNRAVTMEKLPSHIVRHPSIEAAKVIVDGGLSRRREVYYPAHELVPLLWLRTFAPGLVDWIVRAMTTKS